MHPRFFTFHYRQTETEKADDRLDISCCVMCYDDCHVSDRGARGDYCLIKTKLSSFSEGQYKGDVMLCFE